MVSSIKLIVTFLFLKKRK